MPLLLPYFKFNASDWLLSEKVDAMNSAQAGAYIRLLAHCWASGTCTLPADQPALKLKARWTGTDEEWAVVSRCFISAGRGRLTNARLRQEWEAAMANTEERRQSGLKGAASRWAIPLKPATPSTQPPPLNGREYRTDSKEILAFLNLKTGKHFREVEANLSMIEARLKSGVDVQTCKTLIARKVRDWTPKPEMVGYLRPETLFNKTKFETYLAEVTP